VPARKTTIARGLGPACCGTGEARPLPPVPTAKCVEVFRALGDATRLDVFRLIASRREPICVCEITPRFGVGQPTISHHLRVLREAGLVTATRRGVWAYYEVNSAGVEAARALLDAVLPEAARAGA
jgi:ArsR family transcriptional regulator